LVQGLCRQAIQLFTFPLSYLGCLLSSSGYFSRFYRYMPYGTTVILPRVLKTHPEKGGFVCVAAKRASTLLGRAHALMSAQRFGL
jgi:hypothetical protein